jgi:hypothetical protein
MLLTRWDSQTYIQGEKIEVHLHKMYGCGCLESTFIGGQQATCARPRNPEASLNDLVPSARCAPSAPDAKRKETQTPDARSPA